jgi:hypothetical protein
MDTPTSPAAFFDAYVKHRGGRLEPSVFTPEVQKFFSEVEGRANGLIKRHVALIPRTTPKAVHFDFISNNRINAVAFSENLDFIGINGGSVIVLMHIFQKMLSHPGVLPWIGNSALETEPLNPWGVLPKNIDELVSADSMLHFPKDVARSIYSNVLTSMAFDFLVTHELEHLKNGHVDLLKNMLAMNFIEEAVGYAPSENHGLTLQTLEMDADAAAMQWILRHSLEFTDSMTSIQDPEVKEWGAIAYASHDSAVFALGFSIYTFFRLFDEHQWDVDSLESRSHPPLFLRYWMMSSLIPALAQKWKLEARTDAFLTAWVNAMVAAEKACALIVGGRPVWDGMHSAREPKSQAHMFRLLEHWKILRPQLEPLKRGGNLAP